VSEIEDIVRELRTRREELGLGQDVVAQRMGYAGKNPQSHISRWELGKKTPSDEVLTRWALVLGMELRITRTLAPAPKK
jgi:transcriptional regulator with XRE-family HTH domain